MTYEELRDSVAIVGMACRFPGANSVDAFWHNLRQGSESVSFFSDQELERAVIDPAELDDPNYVRARAILDDVERFDAAFFGFTPKEAELTDPQHRVFLECAWEALENAGYNPESYPGLIGIYGGAGANTYMLFHLSATGHLVGSAQTLRTFIHNKNDHLTTRVAYKLNLRGPSITVQTACSTSLVAVSLACQSLLNYQVDMALAGGVGITVPQKTGYLYHERGIGSPDGHCRAFDAHAQGTVGGNGAGVVVLKRFEDALASGDTICAVIRATAINNDGALRAGYTAPNGDSQADVIALAHALAGVEPGTITYVEAHGTGTPIGDPIEIQALTQAFRRGTDRKNFCAVGAVKSNIGHLDTAAGIAGLIKTVLALQHKQIPPSLHVETPNQAIDFANSPFYVNTRLRDWHTNGTPRRAGVSSFGLGGTNAHAVLEEAPPRQPSGPSRPLHLLLLSGKTASALEQVSINLVRALKQNRSLNLADVAYTLQVGRKAFEHRRMLVCRGRDDAIETLEALVPERVFTRAQEPAHRPLTFMFPGQGAQYLDMAAELYQAEATFRAEIDRCAELLAPHLGLDLREVLYPDLRIEDRRLRIEGTESSILNPQSSILDQTQYTQPALFVVSYALARLWMSWGIQPRSMIGHSIGEYVAACLAGVFSLEDALALVAARGRLIQSLPEGAMLAVPLAERDVRRLLAEQEAGAAAALSLASVNSLAQCVVSGPVPAIDALERQLLDQEVICRRLPTSHAFHSAMMEPILEQFAAAMQDRALHPPQIPYISNVTGTWITAAEATDPQYWVRHIRQTVRFADGLAELLQAPDAALLEVGPGHTLRSIARWHPHKKPDQCMLATLPGRNAAAASQPDSDYLSIHSTIGLLWLAGIEVSWPDFYAQQERQRLPLPTYPFERQRYWVDLPDRPRRGRAAKVPLGRRADSADWLYLPVWKGTVLPAYAASEAASPATWLVFADESSLAARLAARLEQAQQRVIQVRPGAAFRQRDDSAYTIRPHEREDYLALVAALRDQDRFPQHILHCWGITADDQALETAFFLERGFTSLLYLSQALGSQQTLDPLDLFVVTNNMQDVIGGDLLYPQKAIALGPCLVVPREYPNITCRSIDITLPMAGSWQERDLDDLLFHEVTARLPENIVAYRAGRRWERAFEPVKLAHADGSNAALRQGGVYLITGGLGGIGMEIAGYLARTAQAKLVLVGRSVPPERATWSHWLATHDPQDRQARQIRQIQQLEAGGAQVLVAGADVADEAQMRAVLACAHAQFGPVNGVVHAAGVPGGGVIQLKELPAAAAVLSPKLQGTLVLAKLLEGTALDFFVLQSSLTSVVGRFGQVDYTAANAFLDAFAHYHYARTGIPTTAINWDAWEHVGMAAQPGQGSRAGQEHSAPGAGNGAAYEGGVVQQLDHPLLERRVVDSSGREIYLTDFNVDKHWVLDEHRILGNPVIPGVAYFEMVRAALGDRAEGRPVEFQDVFFVAPLRVLDGETREVRLVLEANHDGYSFAIRSASGAAGNGVDALRDFTIGKVRIAEPRPLNRYDLGAIRERCNLEEILLAEEQREEDLGPRWHTVQRVHIGHNEVLLVMELPEAFAADFKTMKFHPALLDRAAGIAKNFLAKDDHYLPLTYKSLKINAPLQRKIYSYARFREEESLDRETITFDIVLLNEVGDGLVEISGFSQKRVNDPAVEIRALADATIRAGGLDRAAAAEDQDVAPAERANILPREGVAVFERVLSARLTPQVVVSVRDLDDAIASTDAVVRERILEAAEAQSQPEQHRHARPNLNTPYVAPETESERMIASVWMDVLGIDRIGTHDNFFELGGDSLIAIQVISRLERTLKIDIPPVAVFEGATVHALAQLLNPQEPEKPAYDERQSRGAERRNRMLERRSRT